MRIQFYRTTVSAYLFLSSQLSDLSLFFRYYNKFAPFSLSIRDKGQIHFFIVAVRL